MYFKVICVFILLRCFPSLMLAKSSGDKKVEVIKASSLISETNGRHKVQPVPTQDSQTCGGILEGEISGTITYKWYGSVYANERCAWIISNPNVRGYSIFLTAIGPDSSVIVQGFGKTNSNATLLNAASTVILRDSNVVLITFFTKPSNASITLGPGFSLYYIKYTEGGYKPIRNPTAGYVVPGNIGFIKHPPTAGNYTSNEITPFVFMPVTRESRSFGTTEIVYIRNGLYADGCYDPVSVYKFIVDSPGANKWVQYGILCDYVSSELITHSDLILLLFKSDALYNYPGFYLHARAH